MSFRDNTSLTEAQHDSLVGLAAMDLLSAEPKPWSIATLAALFGMSVERLQAKIDLAIADSERRLAERKM
jgi:hypothetical protein